MAEDVAAEPTLPSILALTTPVTGVRRQIKTSAIIQWIRVGISRNPPTKEHGGSSLGLISLPKFALSFKIQYIEPKLATNWIAIWYLRILRTLSFPLLGTF